MNRRSSPLRHPVRARHAGFTLIELLTVISIILVLAGLLLHIAGSANYKGSIARATAEIKAMETSLESYKADNGAYPRILPTNAAGTSFSDTLNAQSDVDPGGSAKSKYQGGSQTLYQALSGITAVSGTNVTYGGKRYMEFKPGQLADAAGGTFTNPTATTMIVDPFGLPYGYSTVNVWAVEQGKTDLSTYGYNPTFDLWCSGSYGSGGKPYPSGMTTGATCSALWAKNW